MLLQFCIFLVQKEELSWEANDLKLEISLSQGQ